MSRQNAARALVYRFLSRVFRRPDDETLAILRRDDLDHAQEALQSLGASGDLLEPAQLLVRELESAGVVGLQETYDATFEPWGGGQNPLNETAHAPEAPAEALTRTFELADIAGFYRAFGVMVSPETERPDHLAVQLEFMHLLAVKEAYADGCQEPERAGICHDAARTFLDDHLLRWCPKLPARLEECAGDSLYRTAAVVLDRFLALDAAQLGEAAG